MKHLFSLLLTALLCVSMLSCAASKSNNESDLYPVALYGSMEIMHFRDAVRVIDNGETEYTENNAAPIKEVTFLGETHSLSYCGSSKDAERTEHTYELGDGSVNCVFNNEEKLIRVIAEGSRYEVLDLYNSENEYLQWSKQLLLELGIADVSNLKYSCETSITVSGEDSAWGDIITGFYTPKGDNEKLTGYTFSFTRYSGSIPTADKIRIIIHRDSIAVWLSEDRFSDAVLPSVDMESVKASIEGFFGEWTDKSKYAFVSYELESLCFSYINDEIYLKCAVAAVMRPTKSNSEIGYTVMIDVLVEV